jgi:D-alanyl-D-alanine endopeptidase (penicillin-binding protein 7)
VLNIPQKIQDFLFSFGLMFLGLILLFGFSVKVESKKEQNNFFPKAKVRQEKIESDDRENILPKSKPVWPLPKTNTVYDSTSSVSAILALDTATAKIIYEKNSEIVRPLASVTKLMTAMVLLDLPIDWSASVKILDIDCDSSSHQLKSGDFLKLSDLWNVALVSSANSAIKALVRNSTVTPEKFVELMNKKAKNLNLNSMVFTDPTGLHSGNLGSAKDVAQLLKESLKSEKILKSLQMGEYYINSLSGEKPRKVYSTNWLLTDWIPNKFASKNIVGKTGFIYDSGYNFTVRLSDEKNHQISIVVLGAQDNETRFIEARDLGNWIFQNYLWPEEEGYTELAK